jgi:hypothetical protein
MYAGFGRSRDTSRDRGHVTLGHRVENKCSTEANYGRFYPGWVRPSNKREGREAKPLPQGQKAHTFDVTEAALIGEGPILAQPWWERTTLTKVESLPNQPANLLLSQISMVVRRQAGRQFSRLRFVGSSMPMSLSN